MLKAVIFDMDGVLVDTEPLADLHFSSFLKDPSHNIQDLSEADKVFVNFNQITLKKLNSLFNQ